MTPLDRFEELLVTQPPAVPWTPVTDYSAAAREPVEGPHADRIVETFHPKDVLDYGCGPGHLLRLLRERGVPNVVGYDPNRPSYRDIWRRSHWFDLVICREVLEHVELRAFAATVRDLCRCASRYVYLTTRFHPHPTHLLDVATQDDLDPTHITLVHQDLLRALIVLEGFKRDRQKETALDWLNKGRVLVYERIT